jgi:ribonucrease Y
MLMFPATVLSAFPTTNGLGGAWTLAVSGEFLGIGAAAAVIGAIVGFVVAGLVRGQSAAKSRAEIDALKSAAQREAAAITDRAKVDADKAVMERRSAFEQEAETSRRDIRETEKRLAKREDLLDQKLDALSKKDEQVLRQLEGLKVKEQAVETRQAELDRVLAQQTEKLLNISGYTMELAKQEVLVRVEEDCRLETSKVVAKLVDEAQAEAKVRSQEITLMAIQRYASEHTADGTVRSVAIPNDEMKGRIIGREGRNIRAIEKATGVDIIVDDTPGVIVVSCFDKIRQAVAVESLNRLIADGRMHPSRIEEIVEKVKSEMDERVIKAGKDAVLEVQLRGIHPKVSEAMGKLSFRTSYGQNVLRHSVEVAFMSQIIADQLGLDGNLARRCGFLHDIGKAMDHEMEGGHPKIGMDFAKQFGEKDAVLNAIGGHHGDIPSTTFYTPIVMAADAVSSARPGARRESLEKYVQRLNDLQDIAMRHSGVTEAYAIQAGREVRVMVDAKRVGDDEAQRIAFDIAKKVSEEMTFPGEIRVTVLRETRAIEFAR